MSNITQSIAAGLAGITIGAAVPAKSAETGVASAEDPRHAAGQRTSRKSASGGGDHYAILAQFVEEEDARDRR